MKYISLAIVEVLCCSKQLTANVDFYFTEICTVQHRKLDNDVSIRRHARGTLQVNYRCDAGDIANAGVNMRCTAG